MSKISLTEYRSAVLNHLRKRTGLTKQEAERMAGDLSQRHASGQTVGKAVSDIVAAIRQGVN